VNNLFLKFFIRRFSKKIKSIQLRYFRQKSDNKLNGILKNDNVFYRHLIFNKNTNQVPFKKSKGLL